MKLMLFKGLMLISIALMTACLHLRNNDKSEISSSLRDEVSDELKKAKNYPDFITNIAEIVKDEKKREKLNKLIQEGEPLTLNEANSDESHQEWTQKFQLHLVPLDVDQLRPTQSQISLQKSLNYVLKDKEHPKKYFSDKGQLLAFPIITYAGKYVLDGHHRWSQLYIINPKAKILAYDFAPIDGLPDGVPPLSILAKMQATIGTVFGTIPSSSATGDIDLYGDKAQEGIKNYLDNVFNVPKKAKIEDPPEVNSELIKNLKLYLGLDDAGLRKYFEEKIKSFITNTKPKDKLPDRSLMPQTDGGKEANWKNVDTTKSSEVIIGGEKKKSYIPFVVSSLKKKSLKLPNGFLYEQELVNKRKDKKN